ncbi:MAG: hypothetical protein HWN80_07595 [Candidatus Lokiarchaeota archaeon]|nr:hypothetical protein [Candidatus Lokiarchaeota archaeon]
MLIFPFSNIVVGTLIFIVGFIFHWVGQLVSIVNWEFSVKIGIHEKNMVPEYKVYEYAMAIADVSIGWIYALASIGLTFNFFWGNTLAWFPGVLLLYHSIAYWVWIGKQNKAGNSTTSNKFRIVWFLLNFSTGILCILAAL